MIDLIKRFKKKPIIIEAFEWDGKRETIEHPDIKLFMSNNPYFKGEQGSLYIHTLEGVMEARPGDFIIKGMKGEIYPCKPDIFWNTYEEVFPEEPKKEEEKKPEEEKPVPTPKQKAAVKKDSKEIPEKFQNDLKAPEERAGSLEELKGETIEIDLQDLNTICPRTFVKAKSYMGLIGYLKKAYDIELKITSQRSK